MHKQNKTGRKDDAFKKFTNENASEKVTVKRTSGLMDVEIFQVTLCILQWQHFCYFITQM